MGLNHHHNTVATCQVKPNKKFKTTHGHSEKTGTDKPSETGLQSSESESPSASRASPAIASVPSEKSSASVPRPRAGRTMSTDVPSSDGEYTLTRSSNVGRATQRLRPRLHRPVPPPSSATASSVGLGRRRRGVAGERGARAANGMIEDSSAALKAPSSSLRNTRARCT